MTVITAPTEPTASFTYRELEDPSKYVLDATFRCDQCGAQAYFQATLKSDLELFFCRHHGLKHHEAILPLLKEWYSEEARLFDENKLIGSEN